MTAAALERERERQALSRTAMCVACAALAAVLDDALATTPRRRWIHRAGLRAVRRLLHDYERLVCEAKGEDR